MATPKEAFIPHKNAPGPARLEMPLADNSGVVNTDPQFIADRIAIQNHFMAYSYLIDEGRWDDWFDLFSDDVSFETTVPTLGSIIIKGKEAFRAFVDIRYVQPGKTSKGVRRHTQGNFHVAEQTATTAKARSYMTISSVPAGDHVHDVTSGTYNANLEKRDGRWTITRWYVETDAPVSPSGIPPGFENEITAIPDPYNKIPGAPEVAEPYKGKVNLKNHPFSMGGLYKNEPTWKKPNIDVVFFIYLTTAGRCSMRRTAGTFPIPICRASPVKAVGRIIANISFGPTTNPCLSSVRFEGEMYLDVPLIYVIRRANGWRPCDRRIAEKWQRSSSTVSATNIAHRSSEGRPASSLI